MLALCGAYYVYAFGVGFLVGEGSMADRPKSETARPPVSEYVPIDEPARVARRYLPDQEWAADADVQLNNGPQHDISQGGGTRLFYYSQSWTQTDDKKSLRFEPLALIWFRKGETEPFTIVAESAVMTFENEVDSRHLNPGRVVGGELQDEVVIRGPDNLEVKGRRFTFSEKSGRIFSQEEVSFAWKEHRGEAEKGIQIDLDVDDAPAKGTNIAIRTVREVHLFRNVLMNFQFEQDGKKLPLVVEAAGTFRLQFQGPDDSPADAAIATFEDDVSTRLQTSPGKYDALSCNRLDMFITRQAAEVESSNAVQQETLSNLSGPGGGDLALQRMRATGSRVRLVSDENGFQADMSSLDYDVRRRRVLLNDFDPQLVQVGRHISLPHVSVAWKNSEMECLQVELHHDSEHRFKEVFCRGKGWLAYRKAEVKPRSGRLDPVKTVLFAEWQKQLRRFTDPRSGQDVIDLSGNAVVRIPEQSSGITADYIKVWSDPIDLKPNSELSIASNSESTSDEATPMPRRILALDQVTLVSPQLQGNMEELQVWFEDAPPKRQSNPASGQLTPASLRIDPNDKVDSLVDASDNALKNPTEPVVVRARLTQVRMVKSPEEKHPSVAEVWCEDAVEITHRRTAENPPVVLKGERLHLENQGDAGQRVHLVGKPAQIDDPRLHLSGEELFFDRDRNQAWVEGAGTMKIPVETDFEGRPLEAPTVMTITWNEQMFFDGLVASFTGRVNALMLDSTMRCRKMKVTMSERFSFQDSTADAPRPDIARVVCQFHVEFDSHVVEDGAIMEVRRARFAAFAVDNLAERAEARGPGIVTIWRRGRGKRAALAPHAASRANSAMRADGTAWEYSRIDFAGDMVGHIGDRSTVFRRQVQVIYGPVKEPLQTIDLDNLPKDGGAMSCDTLEFVQRKATGEKAGDQKYVELLAKDNARLEGKSFFAQADEISFDESKGLYMLKSYGNNQSMLWREKQRGGKRTAVVTRTLRFIPSRNFVDLDTASHVQGVQ